MRCVIVAALSTASDLQNVERNLARFPSSWDRICLAHEHIRSPPGACDHLLLHKGYGWSSLLNATRGLTSACTDVALLLDDVRLDTDPELVLDDMRAHELDVASPRVAGASHAFMRTALPLKRTRCVLRSRMIEYFATFFAPRAWQCFLALLSADAFGTATGGLGWGYDVCHAAACPNDRFGVLLHANASHLGNSKRWPMPHPPTRSGRSLTLRSIPERIEQANKLKKWARRAHNTDCLHGTWTSPVDAIACTA